MTSQTFDSTGLQPSPLPPSTATLNFTPVSNVSSSSATILDANASLVYNGVTAAAIDMIRISLTQVGGTLGLLTGTTYTTTGTETGNILYSFDTTTRILTLDGDANTTEAQYTAALKKVAFNAQGTTIANQSISANLGRPVYYAQNGHYYEFVPFTQGGSTTWTSSNTAASTRTLFNLTGYLATITSQAENDFVTRSFDSKGWMGARADLASGTRTWKWVSGPEAGTAFRTENIGTAGSITGVNNLGYNNWSAGEPNNFGTQNNTPASTNNEPFAHFLKGGKWNDLADNATQTQVDQFRPDGYWVEYSTASGTGDDGLGSTRKTGSFSIGPNGAATNAQELDLVFYEQSTGQVYFGFPGQGYNINTVDPNFLLGDAPKLILNGTTPVALKADSSWRLVTADVDVDRDGKKDIILQNNTDGRVAFWFGATRTGTSRDYAATRYALLTSNGQVVTGIPEWRVEFASERLGESNGTNNGSVGLFWRSTVDGRYGVGQLGISVNANAPGGMTIEHIVPKFLLGAGSEWTAIGDGEFDSTASTREILWRNTGTGEVSVLSYNAARSGVAAAKYITQIGTTTNFSLGSDWSIRAIANFDGTGNDEILFQLGTTIAYWKMDANNLTGYSAVRQVAAGDRIKDTADVNKDGVLDIVAQNDLNATVGAYTLNTDFTYKGSTDGSRSVNYSVQGGAYRPGRGEGGVNWELVNVAQYDVLA